MGENEGPAVVIDESGEERQALRAAIEHLYETFAGYGLRNHIDGCPHCVSESDQAKLRSRSLRELTPDDLERYSWKAMTTWGEVEDYKHFLPRLLELAAGSIWRLALPSTTSERWVATIDEDTIAWKLACGKWEQWPLGEQDAVKQFLLAFWGLTLTATPGLGLVAADWLTKVVDGPWSAYASSQDDEDG